MRGSGERVSFCRAQSTRELAAEVGLALRLDGSSFLPLGLRKVTQIAPALVVQGRVRNAMPRDSSDGNGNSWSFGSPAHGFSPRVLTRNPSITCS